MAHRAEQRRRFKAILCTKPKTFSQIREERKRTEKEKRVTNRDVEHLEDEEKDDSVLDGFFLV